MESEFINKDDPVKIETKKSHFVYYLIIGAVLLLLAVAAVAYFSSGDCAPFQGAFPSRSDVGADQIDLYKELESLANRQFKNFSK